MRNILLCGVWLVCLAALAWATPSTTYWTTCTMDIQAPGTTHLTTDNYFTIGKDAPGLALGVFNVGTKRGATNQNIFHLMVGKTIPGVGRLTVSGYIGNREVLKSSDGETEAHGFMVAWDRWVKEGKIMLAADYASGKNAIGGGGVGVYFFFNKDTDLLVGPVWFNDKGLNGKMKWTTQIDVNF